MRQLVPGPLARGRWVSLRGRLLRGGQQGQGYTEYALILVLVALLVIAIVFILGQQTHNTFSNISGQLGNAQH